MSRKTAALATTYNFKKFLFYLFYKKAKLEYGNLKEQVR